MEINNVNRDAYVERIRRDGYAVVENAIEPALIDSLSEALRELECTLGARPAMNGFEGHRTVRIYNLLRFSPRSLPIMPSCRSWKRCSIPAA
jgi:hypothetical protein